MGSTFIEDDVGWPFGPLRIFAIRRLLVITWDGWISFGNGGFVVRLVSFVLFIGRRLFTWHIIVIYIWKVLLTCVDAFKVTSLGKFLALLGCCLSKTKAKGFITGCPRCGACVTAPDAVCSSPPSLGPSSMSRITTSRWKQCRRTRHWKC